VARAWGKNVHWFFFGYGLSLIQLLRLLRPLNRREKGFSLFIAFLQIGVACTVILDYRFMLVFLATLILIPRALMELAAEDERPGAIPPRSVRWPLGWWSYGLLGLITLSFYLLFPRGLGLELSPLRMGA